MSNDTTKKKKPLSYIAYVVIWWGEEVKEDYGIEEGQEIITVEPLEDIKVNISKSKIGRPKIRFGEPLAIFENKKEAEAYRQGNSDWRVVRCKILLEL